jgi:4-diphosphocytidyl-2-C-methyl-D-erythritol kinase
MGAIRLRAPGKINWTLDVTGRRPDGYHEVEILMQSISLWDDIVLTECDAGIQVCGNAAEMPLDESNLAAKAARLIQDQFGITRGIRIDITKRIPVAAGLAGGSTNAAAVLAGLNALWGLGLSRSRLAELGTALGADVPFCIYGGTAATRGIGEKITPLPPLEGISLVLIKPPFGVSTASVYQSLKVDRIPLHPNWKKAYDLLAAGNFHSLRSHMGNVLELVTINKHPEIKEIKACLDKAGASVTMMTGSGPAVFGVFEAAAHAQKAAEKLKSVYSQVYCVSTCSTGVEITEGGSL